MEFDLKRYEEAERAFRAATNTEPGFSQGWRSLARVLYEHLRQYGEALQAFQQVVYLDPDSEEAWQGIGSIALLHRFDLNRAAAAYRELLRINQDNEDARHAVIFIERDFEGQGAAASHLMEDLPPVEKSEYPDTLHLQKALFASYDANWGIAQQALSQALEIGKDGFNDKMVSNWMIATAVLIHLGYGPSLLTFLEERGDNLRLRPWFEAIRAHAVANSSNSIGGLVAGTVNGISRQHYHHWSTSSRR